jgi:hypothetical protein
MGQHGPLYENSPALQLVGAWLQARLPSMDPIVTRRFIQLTASVFDARIRRCAVPHPRETC